MSRTRCLEGQLILVVEDEPLIAFDVTRVIMAAGATVVSAGYLETGLFSVGHPELAAAVVDLHLGDGSGAKICDRLLGLRVPFIIHTAYPQMLASNAWPSVPIITKPARPEQIVSALVKLLHRTEPVCRVEGQK